MYLDFSFLIQILQNSISAALAIITLLIELQILLTGCKSSISILTASLFSLIN
jgi:hypothetical protein